MFSKKTSNKITWSMFICSIIIVFRHSSGYKYFDISTYSSIDNIVKTTIDMMTYSIFAVAMPTFFFFSGFLLYRNLTFKSMGKKLKSRIKTVIIPYFAWNVLWMVFLAVIEFIPFITDKIDSLVRFEFSYENIAKGILLFKYNDVYWYMFQLIIYLVLCPIIYYLIRKRYVGIILIGALTVAYIQNYALYIINLEGILFYVIGAYMALHNSELMEKKYIENSSLMSIAAFIVGVIILQLFKTNKLEYLLLTFVLMISGWIILEYVSSMEPYWWMKIYFFTYSIHRITQQCINKIICIVLPDYSAFAIINWIGGVVLTIGLTTAIAWVLIKYMPSLWKILCGGRIPEIKR